MRTGRTPSPSDEDGSEVMNWQVTLAETNATPSVLVVAGFLGRHRGCPHRGALAWFDVMWP